MRKRVGGRTPVVFTETALGELLLLLLDRALPRALGAVGASLLELVVFALPRALRAVGAAGLKDGCR